MSMASDIVNFLRTDRAITQINFDFDGFLVYPQAYSTDVADLIGRGIVGVRVTPAMDAGVGASYYPDYNEIWVPSSFSVKNDNHTAILVHEATHTHMDYKKAGTVKTEWAEAIGYLAEAYWRRTWSLGPVSTNPVRLEAMRVATRLHGGGVYKVPAADVTSLIAAVKREPHYTAKPPTQTFDGF